MLRWHQFNFEAKGVIISLPPFFVVIADCDISKNRQGNYGDS